VTAKGADYIAERIRDVARENNVPIVENQPLAQALYQMADIGDYIPVDLYRAVAEVLAYVYRLRGRQAV
jgi:flagellar biosynthetic protein FlhB